MVSDWSEIAPDEAALVLHERLPRSPLVAGNLDRLRKR